MRLAVLALALGLAPLAGNAAGLIEIPVQNDVWFDEIYDISGDGRVVVGLCRNSDQGGIPCRWSESGEYELLAVLPDSWGLVEAASHDGSIVAGYLVSPTRTVAARWRADGSLQELEPLPGASGGIASAISADGSVVVGSTHWDGQDRPFRWTENTGMVLAPDGTEAAAISSDASVVAACCVPGRWPHRPSVPFLWHSDGRLQPLPMLHWSGDRVWGLSGDGQVVLLAPWDLSTEGFAWRWSAREWAQPVLRPTGLMFPKPHDASADGSAIVGTTDGFEGPGFLWRAGVGDRSLPDALSDAGVDVSGWTSFRNSRAISDDGCRIPALGVRSNGVSVGVLIVLCGDEVDAAPPPAPVPVSSAVLFLAIGLLAASAIPRKRPFLLAALVWLPAAAQGAGIEAIEPIAGIRLTGVSDLSGDGAVLAGWCADSSSNIRPCRWRVGVGAELLASDGVRTSVHRISYDGSVVVGTRRPSLYDRAVLWNAAGGLEELPVVDGLISSEALGVSADGGVVVGRMFVFVTSSSAAWRLFRWTRATGIEILPFGGSPLWTSADGETILFMDGPRSMLWRSGEDPIEIPAFGGAAFYATALSPDGTTVVGTEPIYPSALALRWTLAAGPSVLGPVSYPFFLQPTPSDVSADGGVVVGTDGAVGGAFVWDADRGLRRLWDLLIAEPGTDATAWDLHDLSRVSDDGRTAVGWGYEDGVGTHFIANLAPACEDGLDNDADGLIDLADGQCTAPSDVSEHPPPSCGLGFEVALLLPLLAARRVRRHRA